MAGLYDLDIDAQVIDDWAVKWDDPDNAAAQEEGFQPQVIIVS